ncbi:cytochrome C oxidase subunit IV family protein [Blastopirellula sp. J2-11]|uniref:cytochrome C oxidase subunit IV family protein n=1 Tax=Blastopirellula sp. J2-11 TaxID=2943192 RepID=UPI0021C6B79F|nr:cytochrome C oxidase subunit IV family protein [Blastopirellula sp. J2-11]UUO08055.1 cytochrome C oxidase subunit IV family protein [Blastopirellula sp. J2-11]
MSPTEHAESHHEAGHDHEHEHGGTGKYWAVFLALCVLTGCSFLTYFEMWHNAIPVSVSRAFMMAVSCSKALLVMAFFMHLIWEANWKWVLTVPAAMMSLFLVCMLIPDIGYRTYHYSSHRWNHTPEPIEQEAHPVEGATAVPQPGH